MPLKQIHQEAIYLALAQIPCGYVITYGQLAALAGLSNGARLAGKVLCGLPKETELPWHRVVNAQGRISLPSSSSAYAEQKKRLVNEGVQFNNEKINLALHGYTNRFL